MNLRNKISQRKNQSPSLYRWPVLTKTKYFNGLKVQVNGLTYPVTKKVLFYFALVNCKTILDFNIDFTFF